MCALQVKRLADERNKQAEQRFLELQATCEELQRLLAERDAQQVKVRHRLDDALAAGRSFSAGRLPKGSILRRHLSPRGEGEEDYTTVRQSYAEFATEAPRACWVVCDSCKW